MRYLLLTKWIQEINQELEKARKEVNLQKILELRILRDQLLELRDGVK